MIKAVSGGILLSLLLVTQSQAGGGKPAGNAVRGKMLFMQCAACHAVKEGAPAKIGPNLAGIVGKNAAAQEGFRYSPAMEKAAADGLKWTLRHQRRDQPCRAADCNRRDLRWQGHRYGPCG